MDASDLQDDVDKLSKILDEPDPEDLNGEYDDASLNPKCEIGEGSEKHLILRSTSPYRYACQSSTLAPYAQQEKHECDQHDSNRTPSFQPDDQQSNVHDVSPELSISDEDGNGACALHVSGDEPMELQENTYPLPHISQPTDDALAEPPREPPPPPPPLLSAADSHMPKAPSRAQQSAMPPPPPHPLPLAPGIVAPETPSQAQQSAMPPPPPYQLPPAPDTHAPEARSPPPYPLPPTSSTHAPGTRSQAQQSAMPPPPPYQLPPAPDTHAPEARSPPPYPLPPTSSTHAPGTRSQAQQSAMPPPPPYQLPPAPDTHAPETPSQAQQSAMPPPPPPSDDDAMYDFEGLLQSYTPDFDPPDAVVESDAGGLVTSKVPDSGYSLTPGVPNIDAGNLLNVGQSAGLSGDVARLSEILDIPDGYGGGDVGGGEDMERTQSPAPPTGPRESSALQGDINKLSQVLAVTPAAPPMRLEPVSRPAVAPSPRRTPSTGRSRSSTCADSGRPSVASTSREQLPSALGDEILSQDFFDDTFIGQEIPVNMENCLALNAAYQEVVDENLADLEQLLRRNRARQAELKAVLSTKKGAERPSRARTLRLGRWNWYQFMYQHFSDADGFGPLPNDDTRTKTARDEYEDLRWSRPWLQSEREKLFEAVLAEARLRHTRMAHHRVAAVRKTFRRLEANAESEQREAALTALKVQLEEAERLLTEAKGTSVLDILVEMDDEYDWQKIAHTNLGGHRSASECRLQWCNFVRPTISHADWTPAEDKRVCAAAADKFSHNRWQAAADELGRTAFQVFQRWVAVLSVTKRAFWTDEESERLIVAVNAVRIGNYINWPQVALRLRGRTSVQCNQRYLALISERRRGRFSAEEDMRLIVAIEELGINDYRDIAKHIRGRSVPQLQNRYLRYLKPTLSRRDWTREEDEKLVRFVCEHGPLWSRAAAEIGNDRNGPLCRMRFLCIELAFQRRGGVPASGGLAENKRFKSDYYTDLRERIKKKLERLKPAAEKDPAEARRQASLSFLSRKVSMTGRKDRAQKMLLMLRRPRQPSVTWSNTIVDMMIAEGRVPHRRTPAAGCREAEAATVTARAWCLPSPTPACLASCAAAGLPASQHEVQALSDWHAALLPGAPESSLSRAASAVGRREYNWRRMPLLPASYASCNAFRSLLLQRPQLQRLVVEKTGPHVSRTRKINEFNRAVATWANASMSGGGDGGADSDTPWLVPADKTDHNDHVVTVRITEKPPGDRPPRQFLLTVTVAEAEDTDRLAERIRSQVPHMVKMDICRRPPPGSGGAQQPPPPRGPPPAADAAGAWHLLVARFVSMFFWPALLSLQPPPEVTDLGGPDLDEPDPDLVDSLLDLYSAEDGDEMARRQWKRAPCADWSKSKKKWKKRE